MDFQIPIEQLPGVGIAYQRKLKKLKIKTLRDLLFHFPARYEDFSNIIPVSKIKIGQVVCLQGKILEIKTIRTWRKRFTITEALLQDDSGAIKIKWFNQPWLEKNMPKDSFLCLAGKAAIDRDGLCISNPACEKITEEQELKHTGRIVPVYPETAGMSSRWLRYLISSCLNRFKYGLQETLPPAIVKQEKLLPLKEALWQVHFPKTMEAVEQAKKRFSFEELFAIGLFALTERAKLAKETAVAIPFNQPLMKRFTNALDFTLTDAQKKCAWQILKDLEKPRPMNRLLEGDVGSGKTVVAAMAALEMAKAGWQVALMAPTEILAKQHFKTIAKLIEKFNLDVGIITGSEDKFISKKLKNDPIEISRKKLLEKALEGKIDIMVGTHALIQEKVKFGKLGLVVLDEQHRFGVEQRSKLIKHTKAQKQIIPHLLSMTATPIPRTLALTIYGDLDLSVIDQLPEGRKKIITQVVTSENRQKVYEFIKEDVKKGGQVFVICPKIEKKEKGENSYDPARWSEAKAVKEEYEKLSKQIFPELKIGMLHGKITSKEKEKIMRNFKYKKIDILVSTSVVEVGVDIPNATVMMIEGSEHFGLAQLHQFRGRVGRSDRQSYCFLLTESKSQTTKQRLRALVNCDTGFKLAEKDLEIRGPGDFLGKRQSGLPDLVMNSLTDLALVQKTREAAKNILQEDPYLKKYPLLSERIKNFREIFHLE